jgi:peptidyl-dipeptidase A
MFNNTGSELPLINDSLHTQYREYMYALWMTLTTNDEYWLNKLEEEEKRYNQLLTSDAVIALTQRPATNDMDYSILRQIAGLKNEGLELAHAPPAQQKYVELWNKVHYQISTYKTQFNGRELNDNEVLKFLQTSTNSKDREKIWYEKMKLGKVIEDELLELVDMRNKIAKSKGYSNFYELKLKSQELKLGELNNVILKLREHLDEDFTFIKNQIDKELKVKFNLKEDPMPWHYNHPFLQETHINYMSDENLTKNKVIHDLKSWFSDKGLDIEDLINNSNITANSKKSSASFCLNIDRKKDVRVSCHFNQNQKSIALLLHELGHALYEVNISQELPFILKKSSQVFISEAIALFFEKLAYKQSWFTTAITQTSSQTPIIQTKQHSINNLLRLYETISITRFEYELYANPSQNLNKLWWDIVEDTQRLKRPDDWNHAFWANKPHLTTLPVYYHNYLLGEVLSSQFHVLLNRTFGSSTSEESLLYLKEKFFRKGNSVYWKRLLSDAFKSELSPEYLIYEIRNNIRDE